MIQNGSIRNRRMRRTLISMAMASLMFWLSFDSWMASVKVLNSNQMLADGILFNNPSAVIVHANATAAHTDIVDATSFESNPQNVTPVHGDSKISDTTSGLAASSLLPSRSQVYLKNHTDQDLNNKNESLEVVVSTGANKTAFKQTDTSLRLVYVHVGKTGGETLKNHLRMSCETRKGPRRKIGCLQSFQNKTESALSRHTFGYFHCGVAFPETALQNATGFVITLRNPLQRFWSWFRYSHPNNCVAVQSPACKVAKLINETRVDWRRDFFSCFATASSLLESLRTNDSCSQIARRGMQGRAPPKESNHLFFSHSYYANQTLWRYPDRPLYVLRTEYFWKDFSTVDALLGGSGSVEDGLLHVNHIHKVSNATTASQSGVYVCCVLLLDIETYLEFLLAAINLDETARQESIRGVEEECGVQSLDDLKEACQKL